MDFKKIDLLKPYDLNCNIFSVYDYDGLSMQELLCQFYTKINDCIKICNETIDLAEWLVNEGLKQEVALKLEQWLLDGTLAEIIDEVVFKSLNDKINNVVNNLPMINIKTLGAIGDGVTDETEIFKEALERGYTLGGVRLFIPRGTYLINGYCDIYSNTYIEFEQGAKIIKNENATSSYLFVCGRIKDRGTVGYGGGAKNVIIKNGTFEGYLDNKIGISFSFNHMENFTLDNCTFHKAIAGGHALDLCGCKDIYIKNCKFEGMTVVEGRGFTEAIQIDNSWGGGLSNNFSNYDNLPTVDVYIENCRFTPLYDVKSQIEYPCPTPFGSHYFMEGYYFKNINFINNYVENYQRLDKGHWGGCIRLYSTQELNIRDNYFKNTMSTNGYAIAIQSKNIDSVTQVSSNINISNNVFEGYDYNGSNGYSIIRIFGEREEGGLSCNNVVIENNRFLDCHIGEEHKTENVCVDAISLENVKNVKIINNYCNNIRRLVYSTWCEDVLVNGNSLYNVHYIPFMILNSNNVNITKNSLNSTGHILYMSNVDKFVISSNIFTNCEGYLAPTYNALSCFKACSNGVISDNICHIEPSEKYDIGNAYSLYTSGKNVVLCNNINIGFSPYIGTVEITSTQKSTIADVVSLTKYE